MTRWEKAIEKLPSIDKYEIMTEMCPFSVFEDVETYEQYPVKLFVLDNFNTGRALR